MDKKDVQVQKPEEKNAEEIFWQEVTKEQDKTASER